MGKTDFVMVRVDSDVIEQLRQIFPQLSEEQNATLIRIILKTLLDGHREEELKRQQESV